MQLRRASDSFDSGKNLRIRARHEDVVLRILLPEHRSYDLSDLLRRLALSENHFGKSLPQRAMMIHFGESQILKREMLQPFDRLGGRDLSGPHRFQNFQKFL